MARLPARTPLLGPVAPLRGGKNRHCPLHARGVKLEGVGIDTWGVDFGLLTRGGELLTLPRHYRDARNEGAMQRAFTRLARPEIYRRTGLQFLRSTRCISCSPSPAKIVCSSSPIGCCSCPTAGLLADRRRGTEPTIASTSQLLDPRKIRWDLELAEKFEIPVRILPTIATPARRRALSPLRSRARSARLRLSPHRRSRHRGRRRERPARAATGPTSAPARGPSSASSCASPSSARRRWRRISRMSSALRHDALSAQRRRAVARARVAAHLGGHRPGALVGELEQLAEATPPLRSLINPDDARFARR